MSKIKIEPEFGPHVMMDCLECPTDRLIDKGVVHEALESFPNKVGLKNGTQPFVYKYNGEKSEEWGISGILLSEDSHITIHTFPEKKQAFVDIFSNTDFETSVAATHMIEAFKAGKHDVKVASRGTEITGHASLDYDL
jgi:S-adenosylmethionine decarboxylase